MERVLCYFVCFAKIRMQTPKFATHPVFFSEEESTPQLRNNPPKLLQNNFIHTYQQNQRTHTRMTERTPFKDFQSFNWVFPITTWGNN